MLITFKQNGSHQTLPDKSFVWSFQVYIHVFEWRGKIRECHSCLKDSEKCLSDAEDYSEMFHAIIKK